MDLGARKLEVAVFKICSMVSTFNNTCITPTVQPHNRQHPHFLSAGQSLPLPQSLYRSLPIKSSVLELPQPSESKDLLPRFASRNGLRLRSAAWDGPS